MLPEPAWWPRRGIYATVTRRLRQGMVRPSTGTRRGVRPASRSLFRRKQMQRKPESHGVWPRNGFSFRGIHPANKRDSRPRCALTLRSRTSISFQSHFPAWLPTGHIAVCLSSRVVLPGTGGPAVTAGNLVPGDGTGAFSPTADSWIIFIDARPRAGADHVAVHLKTAKIQGQDRDVQVVPSASRSLPTS
jgi:hypothetical protein